MQLERSCFGLVVVTSHMLQSLGRIRVRRIIKIVAKVIANHLLSQSSHSLNPSFQIKSLTTPGLSEPSTKHEKAEAIFISDGDGLCL